MEPVSLSVAIGSLVAAGFAIQQNYNLKKLAMLTDDKVGKLEKDNDLISKSLSESNNKLSKAISYVQSLEKEVKSLRATISNASITDIAVAKRLTSLENKVTQHEESLLNAARIALSKDSEEIKKKIMLELQPGIMAIKQVEHDLSTLKSKLRENGIKLEKSLTPSM